MSCQTEGRIPFHASRFRNPAIVIHCNTHLAFIARTEWELCLLRVRRIHCRFRGSGRQRMKRTFPSSIVVSRDKWPQSSQSRNGRTECTFAVFDRVDPTAPHCSRGYTDDAALLSYCRSVRASLLYEQRSKSLAWRCLMSVSACP